MFVGQGRLVEQTSGFRGGLLKRGDAFAEMTSLKTNRLNRNLFTALESTVSGPWSLESGGAPLCCSMPNLACVPSSPRDIQYNGRKDWTASRSSIFIFTSYDLRTKGPSACMQWTELAERRGRGYRWKMRCDPWTVATSLQLNQSLEGSTHCAGCLVACFTNFEPAPDGFSSWPVRYTMPLSCRPDLWTLKTYFGTLLVRPVCLGRCRLCRVCCCVRIQTSLQPDDAASDSTLAVAVAVAHTCAAVSPAPISPSLLSFLRRRIARMDCSLMLVDLLQCHDFHSSPFLHSKFLQPREGGRWRCVRSTSTVGKWESLVHSTVL